MELSELLDAERVRCQCPIQSKKRTLQTLAELLSASLHAGSSDADADSGKSKLGNDDAASDQLSALKKSGRRLMRKVDKPARADRSAEAGKADIVDGLSDRHILEALNSRERLGSTALGHGVALPHSRMAGIQSPMAAMLTLAEGVDFQSDDGEPVDLVVGLLVPEECNDEHLQILASLAKSFSDEQLRNRLREFNDSAALVSHLQSLSASNTDASNNGSSG